MDHSNEIKRNLPSEMETTSGQNQHVPKIKQIKNKHTPAYIIKSLVAGGVAGCAAKTAVAPLDRVKILFQVSNPNVQKHAGSFKGIFGAMSDMYHRNGVRGLFQGHAATILRVFPYAAIKFMAFEQYKTILSKPNLFEKSTVHFMAGSLAGVTSVFFTYPFDMLRTRMAYEVERPMGIREISKQIFSEPSNRSSALSKLNVGGLTNFYRGFVPTVLGIVPYAGVSFWCHSKLTTFTKKSLKEIALETYSPNDTVLNAPRGKARLKWWAELGCGGLAGAVAQTVSYPLEVIRRRMQVAGRESNSISSVRQGIAGTAQQIYKKMGLRGFFIGLSIGYIKVTPMVAISFYTYSRMKQILSIDE